VPADSWSVRLRYLLDAASVALGAGVLMFFVMSYTLPAIDSASSRLFGSIVLAVSSFAATKLCLTGAIRIRARAAVPIVIGTLLQGYAYGMLGSGPNLHLALAGLAAAAGLLWTGVRIHQVDSAPAPDPDRARRRYSLLPYLTLFVMFGLVPFANAAHKPVDFWVVIGALFVITCLVSCGRCSRCGRTRRCCTGSTTACSRRAACRSSCATRRPTTRSPASPTGPCSTNGWTPSPGLPPSCWWTSTGSSRSTTRTATTPAT
jgi:hypothetical protein